MTDHAIDQYRQVLNRAAWNANQRSDNPYIEGFEQAKTQHQQGDYQGALDNIESACDRGELSRTDVRVLNLEALCLMGLHDYDGALRRLETLYSHYLRDFAALRDDSTSTNDQRDYLNQWLSLIRSNQSVCYLALEDYEAASQAALDSRHYRCNWHLPHVNLMSVYRRIEKYEDLDEAVLYMQSQWPDWESDYDLMAHLKGNDIEDADSDLQGVYERAVFQRAISSTTSQ